MNRPTAAPAYFPYDHPTMAEVMAAEERARDQDRKRYASERSSQHA